MLCVTYHRSSVLRSLDKACRPHDRTLLGLPASKSVHLVSFRLAIAATVFSKSAMRDVNKSSCSCCAASCRSFSSMAPAQPLNSSEGYAIRVNARD